MRPYGSGFHGGESYGTASAPSELRFYQMGPEAWVKPGVMGIPWVPAATTPAFCDYQP